MTADRDSTALAYLMNWLTEDPARHCDWISVRDSKVSVSLKRGPGEKSFEGNGATFADALRGALTSVREYDEKIIAAINA